MASAPLIPPLTPFPGYFFRRCQFRRKPLYRQACISPLLDSLSSLMLARHSIPAPLSPPRDWNVIGPIKTESAKHPLEACFMKTKVASFCIAALVFHKKYLLLMVKDFSLFSSLIAPSSLSYYPDITIPYIVYNSIDPFLGLSLDLLCFGPYYRLCTRFCVMPFSLCVPVGLSFLYEPFYISSKYLIIYGLDSFVSS